MEEHAIWTEKYRPQDFSEVKGQKDIVKKIKAFVEQKNMPHILFSGPAGVGKSTLALIIAKKLFKNEWRTNFLELNASDERGIDVIRSKVKDFARTKAISDFPFKIIFLDECLDYDSKIKIQYTNEIKEIKIGELVESSTFDINRLKVQSIDDYGNAIFVSVKKLIKIPYSQNNGFYQISLHNGTLLKLTGNHEVLTIDGWKRADNISKGDFIMSKLSSNYPRIEIKDKDKIIPFHLICLPHHIKKIERSLDKCAEKKVIEVLASSPGLDSQEIVTRSSLTPPKVSMILGKGHGYTSLDSLGLIDKKRENNKTLFSLNTPKPIAIECLKRYKRTKCSNNKAYIESKLKRLQVMPLRKEKALILARLVGHLLGDGSLSLKARNLMFSGKEEDVVQIKKDIETLGFHTHSKIRKNHWKNGVCWSLYSFDKALTSLLYSLEVPVGRKTNCIYTIPSWIKNADKDIKREFIAAFFGSEADKPNFQKRTVKPIGVNQAKREDLIDNLYVYIRDWCKLLEEFDIHTNFKIENKIKNIRKDGSRTVDGLFWVTNSQENILKFLENIGYKYCSYKENLCHLAIKYLKWRISLEKFAYTFRPIPYFEDWLNRLYKQDCAFFYVTSIYKLEDPDFVYCLSVENGKFLANDIVVHNCDALTREAQQALRRTMENYTQTCRFILSANYSSKIIDPIQSRCAVFRFKPLEKKDVEEIVEKIAKEEKLKINEKAMAALYEATAGDCRRVENILQSCAALEKHIDEESIYTMASMARPKEIKEVLALALQNKFIEARTKLLDVMLNYGLSGLDVIKQISKEILDLNIDNRKKMELMDKCGETEFRMSEGSDEFLQLEAFLAYVALAGSK